MPTATNCNDSEPLETDEELTAKQTALIEALLTEPTQEQAAEKVGIHRSTLHRWLKTESFAMRYKDAQRNLFTHTMGRLQGAAGDALGTLREVMSDTNGPTAARVTAAKAVLEFARYHVQTADLEERLLALEERTK